MIEIPEALTIVDQINRSISGKRIINAVAAHSPHKFAWYHGEPAGYNELLKNKIIGNATAFGGYIEIIIEDSVLLFGEGVVMRYLEPGIKTPDKHQLLLEFEDSSKIIASIQMYGGIWCFSKEKRFENFYYNVAKEKPSPLSPAFDERYLKELISPQEMKKLSLKAFLSTEQRIPGLGNGVLQDILWSSRLHPKRKVGTLTEEDVDILFREVKSLLLKMTEQGGRDTEKDIYGNRGGYKTIMSKNNVGVACPKCGETIIKENYMGGSIYYCEGCQKL